MDGAIIEPDNQHINSVARGFIRVENGVHRRPGTENIITANQVSANKSNTIAIEKDRKILTHFLYLAMYSALVRSFLRLALPTHLASQPSADLPWTGALPETEHFPEKTE